MSRLKYSCYVLLLTTRCLATEPKTEHQTFPSYVVKPFEQWPTIANNWNGDPYEYLKLVGLPDFRNPVTLEDFLLLHNVVPFVLELIPNETLQVSYLSQYS